MKLFGLNISRASAAPEKKSLSPEALAWLRGDDSGGQTGTVLANAYEHEKFIYSTGF